MQVAILMFFFGFVCGVLVLAAGDGIDWAKFRASALYQRVTRYATLIREKIRARTK
jgi:hypothetical protein